MNKKFRLKDAYDYLYKVGEVHSQKDVAEKMGATAPNVSSALKGVESVLTDKFISRFADAFPSINKVWLLTGEGEMLNADEGSTMQNSEAEQAKQDAPREEGRTATFVKLIPVAAQGGSLTDFIYSVKEQDCELIASPIRDVDLAIQVSGDSMAPEYPNGSHVYVKRINERAFIEWGKVYVLDTCNGSVIKILVPSDREGYVRCLSINTDPKYAPFEVSLEDIRGVYRVLLCMSIK